MILSRIARALKDQNWLAVGIEFVIVVAGVLLAFQISQFAQTRSERVRALDTLARAETEIRGLIEARDRSYIEHHIQALNAAQPIIIAPIGTGSLSPEQCRAIANSGSIASMPDASPTTEAFVGSGALAAIDNEALRLAAMQFVAKKEAAREWLRLNLHDVDDLTELFPDMVWFQRVEAPGTSSGWRLQAVCDLDAMRASRPFLAHFMGNIRVTQGLSGFVGHFIDQAIADLHTAMKDELGLTHDQAETMP